MCESSSDITNLRDVQSRDIRVLLAGQSSLNTLNVIERVLFTYPSIERVDWMEELFVWLLLVENEWPQM